MAWQKRLTVFVFASALMSALGARAETAETAESVLDQQAEPKCWANGRAHHQGELACFQLPCQEPQLARCGMVLNNPSWFKIQDGCPLTELFVALEAKLAD